MSLAIVIPYYKIQYFENCLRSLSIQTNKDFKVYIGNDGSPDNPKDLIDLYLRNIDFEYHNFQDNIGHKSLVAHWDRIIKKIKNEDWLLILGDDDILGENCVQSFYNSLGKIEESDISVVRFSTYKIDQNGKMISRKFIHPELENSVNFLFRKLKGETRSSLSEYIFRKDLFDSYGLKNFPLAWHTDDLAILECSNFGNVFSLNDANVYFRNSGINISSMKNNLLLKNKSTFLFYYYLLKNYKSKFNSEEREYLYQNLLRTYNNNKLNIKLNVLLGDVTIHLGSYVKLFRFWKDVLKFKFPILN